jgi:hypothetical protein
VVNFLCGCTLNEFIFIDGFLDVFSMYVMVISLAIFVGYFGNI